jgi:hypothetical protein
MQQGYHVRGVEGSDRALDTGRMAVFVQSCEVASGPVTDSTSSAGSSEEQGLGQPAPFMQHVKGKLRQGLGGGNHHHLP